MRRAAFEAFSEIPHAKITATEDLAKFSDEQTGLIDPSITERQRRQVGVRVRVATPPHTPHTPASTPGAMLIQGTRARAEIYVEKERSGRWLKKKKGKQEAELIFSPLEHCLMFAWFCSQARVPNYSSHQYVKSAKRS